MVGGSGTAPYQPAALLSSWLSPHAGDYPQLFLPFSRVAGAAMAAIALQHESFMGSMASAIAYNIICR